MLKKYRFFLLFIMLAIISVGGILLKNEQYEKELRLQREATSIHIRESAKAFAQKNRKEALPVLSDPMSALGFEPNKPSDQDELAQIQLWQKTPPAQRKSMTVSHDDK